MHVFVCLSVFVYVHVEMCKINVYACLCMCDRLHCRSRTMSSVKYMIGLIELPS